MIRLFEQDALDFTSNGITVLYNLTSANSKEVLNGLYSAEFAAAYDQAGKWKEIKEGRVIFADGQPFRIHKIKKGMRSLTAFSRHVFWDLLYNEVRDVRPTNKNGLAAMQDVLGAASYSHPFTAFSDISNANTQYLINRNLVDCLVGEDSILTRWGGELKLDKWQISILSHRGQDNGVTISYGKNMFDIDVDEDYDTVVTRIRPKGKDGLELPEVYVDSPFIGNYRAPRIREVPFDIGADVTTTEEDAVLQLRQAAEAYFLSTKCDVPQTNILVDMVNLEHTEAYRGFGNLVRVHVGDTVLCKHLDLGIHHKARVISIEKDLLTGTNSKVEIGDFKASIPTTLSKLTNTFKDLVLLIESSKSDLSTSIADATNLLTSALGGYALKRNGEFLIMDTEDPETCVQVWRWNLNGLGYSSSGINGPYELAMTIDGVINANMIRTGILSASLIQTGLLKSRDGLVEINLDSGAFNFNNRLISDGSSFTFNFTGTNLEQALSEKASVNSVNAVNAMATATQNQVNANQAELTNFIRFVNGDIILGELNNPVTLKIENDKIAFYQGGVAVAEFTDNQLVTTDVKVNKSIRIGNFAFTPRTNGNLSFGKVT